MNEFEAKSDGESADDMRVLRMLVAVAIFLVCIFIGCIDMTLRRSAISLGQQIEGAQKALEAYEKGDQQRFNYFFGALNEYAKTHADFQPIIQQADRFLTVTPGNPPAKK